MAGAADDAEITGSDGAGVRSVEDLARLLRRLRRREARRRGDSPLTYRELAAKTGWAHSSMGGYLSGQALAPTDRFDVLVQLLGASPAEQGVLATARDRIEERRYSGGPAGEARHATRPGAGPVPRVQSGAPVPHALPAPVPHFTGRHAELHALASLRQAGSGSTVLISAIDGTAGVGKTALALYWAHRIADRFPDGQLHVNLRGFDPAGQVLDPAEALHGFLEALHVPSLRVPATLDGRTALYRSLLAGRRMLIVLDNARDTGQVRPLLPGASGCLVLVTSRNLLSGLVAADGAHPVTLDLLTEDEARELLARRVGHHRAAAEPGPVREIVADCARLPLAIAVVAARIAAHPRTPLAAFSAELRDTHRRWAALTGDDPATDVRAVLSWSYHALGPAAARLFRLLGLHPGPDFTAAAAASLCGVAVAEVRSPLAELARAHLVVEQSPGRYVLHDLLRAYAAGQVRGDPADQREAATRRMLDHYLHSAYAAARQLNAHGDPIDLDPPGPGVVPVRPAGRGAALDWLSAEHSILLAVVHQSGSAGFDAHTWGLAWALAPYLDRRGRWHEWLAVGQAGLAAAERAGDLAAQAPAHRHLASAYTRLNRRDDARIHLRQALDLTARHGDAAGLAQTHLLLSDLSAQQGQHTEALGHARQALDLYRTAGHRRGQADALNSVGWYHALLGEYECAITHCEQALALHRELGHGIVEATAWDSLGYAHHHLGHHEYAITCYQRAVDMFADLGARYYQAETLTRLGDTQQAAGEPGAAHDTWQRALAILDDLDHPEAEQVRAKLAVS
jgi:tetratricopeptide (TPR) repeat protein